jgi:hypothetical protein
MWSNKKYNSGHNTMMNPSAPYPFELIPQEEKQLIVKAIFDTENVHKFLRELVVYPEVENELLYVFERPYIYCEMWDIAFDAREAFRIALEKSEVDLREIVHAMHKIGFDACIYTVRDSIRTFAKECLAKGPPDGHH